MGYFHNDRQQRGRIAELEAINEQHRKLNGELRQSLNSIRQLVYQQAEDHGLWFVASSAPEGYLQQEMRRLHACIEHFTDADSKTKA